MSDDKIRKLAAIMFTDMVGYSALSQRDEKLAQELLEEHRRLLREIFPRFNGIEIKTIGDVVHRAGDVYGDGVNIASRIEPLAGADGICVSMDVERQIRNAVETRFEKLAPTELKNISVPMVSRVYR
jgi:class 3 adenylate cyclase